jgi:hypothetical protein
MQSEIDSLRQRISELDADLRDECDELEGENAEIKSENVELKDENLRKILGVMLESRN